MRKLLLACALGLSLSACATVSAVVGASITQGQVDGARSTYDGGFLAGLHRYALLPKCLSGQTFLQNQCHSAPALKTLRGYDRAAGQGFNSVQANLDAGNNSAALAAWTVLQNTIASANSALASAQAQ